MDGIYLTIQSGVSLNALSCYSSLEKQGWGGGEEGGHSDYDRKKTRGASVSSGGGIFKSNRCLKGSVYGGLVELSLLAGLSISCQKVLRDTADDGCGKISVLFLFIFIGSEMIMIVFFRWPESEFVSSVPKTNPPKIQCNLSGLIQSVLGSWSTSNLSSSIFFPEEIMQYFIAYFHIPNCHTSIKISERSCKWNANLHKLKWKTSTNLVAAWHMHSLGETYVVNFSTVGR